jgi:hypothetical protein
MAKTITINPDAIKAAADKIKTLQDQLESAEQRKTEADREHNSLRCQLDNARIEFTKLVGPHVDSPELIAQRSVGV